MAAKPIGSMAWVRRPNVRLYMTKAGHTLEEWWNNMELFRRSKRPYDEKGLIDELEKSMREKRWAKAEHLFDLWIAYKNKPTVDAYNLYMRAQWMSGASTTKLMLLVDAMPVYHIAPNTESFNILVTSIKLKHHQAEAEFIKRLCERDGL